MVVPNRRRHTQWRSVIQVVPRCLRPPETRPHTFCRLAVCFFGTCQRRFASHANQVIRHFDAGFCARILSFRLWIFRELYFVSRAMGFGAPACCRSVLSFGARTAFQTPRLAVVWAFKNYRHNWIHAALKTGQTLQSKRPTGAHGRGKRRIFQAGILSSVCSTVPTVSLRVQPAPHTTAGVSCRFTLLIATFGVQQRFRQRTRRNKCLRERRRR